MKKLPDVKFKDKPINPAKIEIVPFEAFKNSYKDHNPFKPHRLKFNVILFIINGKNGIHNIDFEDHTFSKENIILVAKEQIHAFVDLPRSHEGFFLLFTEELFLELGASYPYLINHLYNNQLYNPVLKLANKKFKELCTVAFKISQEINYKTEPTRLEIAKSYFKILLLELFYQREKKHNIIKKSPYIDEFIKFQQLLQTNIFKEKKVKFYAGILNITSKQLNVVTQSTINLHAKDYIISLVILEAKKYLKCSDLSFKEIAYKLGFDEPTNFTKFFKKHTQLLPSVFAQSV